MKRVGILKQNAVDLHCIIKSNRRGEGMRKDQCLFCSSRKCDYRIVTPDLKYDEIACIRHSRQLEEHADNALNGALRCNLSTTGQVKRRDPYPITAKESEMVRP